MTRLMTLKQPLELKTFTLRDSLLSRLFPFFQNPSRPTASEYDNDNDLKCEGEAFDMERSEGPAANSCPEDDPPVTQERPSRTAAAYRSTEDAVLTCLRVVPVRKRTRLEAVPRAQLDDFG